MKNIVFSTKVLWSQVDANNHLRHSAYSDLACQARVEVLEQMGITNDSMAALNIGPILFEEKTVYKKEIPPNSVVSVSCWLQSCRTDVARWSFKQEIYREDGTIAAIVTTVGSWMDLKKRRLAIPPPEFAVAFLNQMPRTKDCDVYTK
jgi:acyl-CoA thioester hydrolase